MTKEQICCIKDGLSRQKLFIAEALEKENEQLRQQIEKMRCCANCKHSIYYACELKECDNLDRWELADENN